MMTRKSTRAAALRAASKLQEHDGSDEAESPPRTPEAPVPAPAPDSDSADTRPAKRRKTAPNPKPTPKPTKEINRIFQILFTSSPCDPAPATSTCPLPSRSHTLVYHRPLLLTSPSSRLALLAWFDKVHATRNMPWRKPWIDPSSEHGDPDSDPDPDAQAQAQARLRAALSRRAYEVWISEVMLQQTRVAAAAAYWTRWMARWPTIADLAAAREDDALAMWRGLGYYARARRIHAAARIVCADPDMRGLLPSGVDELQRKVPGVGRYTAGAIAAIVFGRPEPMVDGNVLRVLSRQLGLLGDVKGDRAVVEVLWEAAGQLVKAVAGDGDGKEVSDRPGRWGQALMGLGSTVCTPRPKCERCPITDTCRVYAEGVALATRGQNAKVLEDIEDLCTLCSALEEAVEHEEEEATEDGPKTDSKQGRLSSFFAPRQAPKPRDKVTAAPDARTLEVIANHAQKFPLKKPKKKVREEETLVCAIRRTSDDQYLIHRRPAKGLLAGLWELPSYILPDSNDSSTKSRKTKAVSYASGLVKGTKARGAGGSQKPALRYLGEIGSVPWLFSHLKLTMHVHLFELDDVQDSSKPLSEADAHQRWASLEDIDMESMGTGMRKCWELVKDSR